LLLFIVNNRDYVASNSVCHNIDTRWKNDLHLSLRYLWPCIRREFIIQALGFLTVFPRQLRTSPASLNSLKLL
jgi:hypothetical protein